MIIAIISELESIDVEIMITSKTLIIHNLTIFHRVSKRVLISFEEIVLFASSLFMIELATVNEWEPIPMERIFIRIGMQSSRTSLASIGGIKQSITAITAPRKRVNRIGQWRGRGPWFHRPWSRLLLFLLLLFLLLRKTTHSFSDFQGRTWPWNRPPARKGRIIKSAIAGWIDGRHRFARARPFFSVPSQ